MPMTTMTTNSSTIVKPEVVCELGLVLEPKRFFNLLERERERERDCFFHNLLYYSWLLKLSLFNLVEISIALVLWGRNGNFAFIASHLNRWQITRYDHPKSRATALLVLRELS